MKIAICIPKSTVGGVGTSTYILANGMRKAGHQADILATNTKLGDDYHRALRDGWPVKAIGVGQQWLGGRLKTVYDHLCQYDVVINNHSIETQLLLPALPASTIRLSVVRSTNAPVIADANLNNRYLDSLVAISPEVERLLPAVKLKCNVRLIPNAVMLDSGDFPILEDSLKLIYLGRLTDIDKNILILPEIADHCRKKDLKFQLKVIGGGADYAKLQEKIDYFDLWDNVKLSGPILREEVGTALREAHFAILPSNYEGFGLTLVEAMAAGCVPIASDIPSYRWILGDDAKTLQVPVSDAQVYADRLCAIADDPERYKLIQQRLHRRQRDHFSPESTVSGYLRVIEELAENRIEDRFVQVSLADLPLPKYYKRRCTKAWWFLQKFRYGFTNKNGATSEE